MRRCAAIAGSSQPSRSRAARMSAPTRVATTAPPSSALTDDIIALTWASLDLRSCSTTERFLMKTGHNIPARVGGVQPAKPRF